MQISGEKFSLKTFTDCSLVPPKDATPTNFVEKTVANSHKTSKFATKVFSLKHFPLYGIVLTVKVAFELHEFKLVTPDPLRNG